MTEMEQQDCVDWKGFVNDHKLAPNNQEGKKSTFKGRSLHEIPMGGKREKKKWK